MAAPRSFALCADDRAALEAADKFARKYSCQLRATWTTRNGGRRIADGWLEFEFNFRSNDK
ncbi:MAG: hypothetical protein WA129_00175 [Acidovorax sp.]|jgi:hypothetical protein